MNGQTGSFTLTITTSSTATFDWASGMRPQDSTPKLRTNIRTPYQENIPEPLRAALR
jgi:hypothetical protein